MPEKRPERAVAYKIPIIAITKGTYQKQEEEYAPNYIQLNNKKIARLNIIAIVLEKDNNSITVDDGTAKISARGFEENAIPDNIQIGDIVNIIGRPREYSNERYVLPEIIKQTSQEWMKVRKKELENFKIEETADTQDTSQPVIEEEKVEETSILSDSEKILNFIKQHDGGQGVEIEEIENTIPNSEKIVETMLKEGDLFSNMPGKVKILE